jgi:hypothetical protein
LRDNIHIHNNHNNSNSNSNNDSFLRTKYSRGTSHFDVQNDLREYSWQRRSDQFTIAKERSNSNSLFSTELYIQDKKKQLDALYDK